MLCLDDEGAHIWTRMYLQATGRCDSFSRRGVQCPGSCQDVLQKILSVEQTVGTQCTHPGNVQKQAQ